jgi:hypothetical protein
VNLKDVKVHADNDDHFVVSHGSGTPFRVAKKGIDKLTLTKIQMHHATQHLYDGGMVDGMDSAPDPAAWDPMAPDPSTQTYGFEGGSSLEPVPGSEVSDQPTGGPAVTTPQMQASLEQDKAKGDSAVDTAAEPPTKESAPEDGKEGAAPEPPPAIAAPKPIAINSGPNIDKQLQAGDAMAQDAVRAQAKTAEAEGRAMLALQQQSEARRAALQQNTAAAYKANLAKKDAMMQDIAKGSVNPDHWVQSLSTGQKITGALAMILGGLGAGLSGGRNQALDIINAQIERDIDTQKANLTKKENLVRMYMEEGHSIQEAGRLAAADARDSTAAQLDMLGSKFMGEKAGNAAQSTLAALTKQSATDRQTAFSNTQGNQLRALDIAEKKQVMQLRPVIQAVTVAAESGKSVPMQYRAYLDHDRVVNLGNGKVAYANTSKDRDEAVAAQEALRNGLAAAKRAKELSGTSGFGGADTQAGQLAVTDMQNAYQAALGRSNAPRGKQEEELSSALSNPTSFWKTKAGINKVLSMYEQILKKHAGSTLSTRLVGGGKD